MKTTKPLKYRRCRLTGLALAICALHLPASALEYTWGGSSGPWSDSARWNLLGVPNANDGASIGSGTAFVTSATSVGILRLSGSGVQAGPADLTVGMLVFERGGMGTGSPGRTIVNGSATFDGSLTQNVSAQHELVLNGNSRWTAGNGAIGGNVFGGAVVNTAGATFRDEGTSQSGFYKALRDQQGSYVGGTFVNQGTYVRSGLGTTRLYGFNNAGVLQVDAGTAELRDSFSSSGLITVAAAGTLRFNGGALGSTVDANISGRIDNASGGVIEFERGNNSFSADARFDGDVRIFEGLVSNAGAQTLTALRLDGGGQLTGTGTVAVQTLDFRAGTLGGASRSGASAVGSTTVSGASVFEGTRTQRIAGSHTLTLQGDSRWTAGNGAIGSSDFGGAVVNTAGATFRDEGTSQAGFYKALRDQGGIHVGGTFLNQGTYVRSGLGTTRLYGFNNTGVLQVDAGTAELRDSFSSSGLITVAAAGTLRFNGGALGSTVDANISGRIDNASGGVIEFERGNNSFSAAARFDGDVRIFEGLVSNAGAQTLTALRLDGGGQLTGTGTVAVQTLDFRAGTLGGASRLGASAVGSTTVSGASVFDGTRTQRIAGSHTLTLQGDSRWTAGNGAIGSNDFGGAIVNTAGATFRDEGTSQDGFYKALRDQQGSYVGGVFLNEGTYVRSGLGTTRLYGFNNTGVLQVDAGTAELRNSFNSSGQITIAAAGTLRFNGLGSAFVDADITGRIDNANGGVLEFRQGNNSFSSAARFDGDVRIFEGVVRNAGTQTVSSLRLDGGGRLVGPGSVTVQSLDFRAGTLGGASQLGDSVVGSTTVSGASVFDGTRTQRIAGSHTLTLQGDSRWTAGDGAIGSNDFGGVVVNTAGATFRDEGTSQDGFYKALRDQQGSYVGGVFLNEGTYVRSGLGTTRLYGFLNTGVLQVDAGTAELRDAFSNTGRVLVAAGAVLSSGVPNWGNDGTIEGHGVVRTLSLSHAVANAGTLSPGAADGIGTLTVDGDLTMTSSATLRIELGAAGVSDRLVVTDQVLWNGLLALVPGAGFAPAEGQSFIVASYGQRLSNSTFSGLNWSGSNGITFAVDYGMTDLTVRVTAVPEPATVALWALGLLAIAGAGRSTRLRAQSLPNSYRK